MMKKITDKHLGIFHAFLFGSYVLLSWIVFFRDERALAVFEKGYPSIASWLINSRVFLVHHFLNTVPTGLFIVLVLILFASYIFSLRKKISVKAAIVFAVIFQVLAVFSYPILSVDVLSYINSDRLSVVHHQNVWTTAPDKFPQDKFYPLALDTKFVRIYGPVNQMVYTIPTAISGDDLLTNIFVHKLVVLSFVFASLFLLYKILRQFFPNQVGTGIAALFWNPLFVIETAGSGHNDILMLFFLLLSFYLFQNKRFLWAGVSIALAIQVKTTPLLFLPFLGISFVRRFQIRSGLVFLFGFISTYILTFLSMGTSIPAIIARQGAANGAYWQSLPLLIERHMSIFAPLLKIALVLTLAVQAIRTFADESPWKHAVETLFIYLLFFLPTLWNWYPLWLLAFIPLLSSGKLPKLIIGFTLGTLLAYGTYWVALRLGHQNPVWQFIMYGTIIVSTFSALIYVPDFKNEK